MIESNLDTSLNLLKQDEVLDDLQLDNLQIIQNRKLYCFTSDSVLLANFVEAKKNDLVVEFCSGSGVISILLNAKKHPKQIIGFELDSSLCDMSNRSLKYNKIENIKFLNCNLNNAYKVLQKPADVLVANPPYFLLKKDEKINEKYLNSKYETTTSLSEIFKSANKVLKYSGKFFLEHTPSRVQEVLFEAQKNNFVLKKIKFVYPKGKSKEARLVLMMFTKFGNPGCDVLEPIYD